jgi:hypothetical protein
MLFSLKPGAELTFAMILGAISDLVKCGLLGTLGIIAAVQLLHRKASRPQIVVKVAVLLYCIIRFFVELGNARDPVSCQCYAFNILLLAPSECTLHDFCGVKISPLRFVRFCCLQSTGSTASWASVPHRLSPAAWLSTLRFSSHLSIMPRSISENHPPTFRTAFGALGRPTF